MLNLDRALITTDGRAAVLRERKELAFSVQVAGAGDNALWFYNTGEPHVSTALVLGKGVLLTNATVQHDDNLIRKLVTGLRQVTDNMVKQAEGRMEDDSVESKGFLAEAMDQYADRINGYATELAQSIGYVEPSPEMMVARRMTIDVLTRMGAGRVVMRREPRTILETTAAMIAVTNGDFDDCDLMQDILQAIYAGRALAEGDHRKQRIADMMSAPTATLERIVPDRLTITIDGPRGSGKTTLAEYLVGVGEMARRPFGRISYLPAVIEMREGRRFDVRNEVFLDQAQEAIRG